MTRPFSRSILPLLFVLAAPALRASDLRTAPPECTANAGTISIDFWAGCLANGSATVSAVPGNDAVVPPGFQLVYLLSSSNGLIIDEVSNTPTFVVHSLDIHRIHPLVYDPNTLDLSAFTGGDASVYDIYSLIYNGLCAGLNVSGAPFKVKECPNECTAYAGTISALQPDQCLVDGAAGLEAVPDDNAVVPAGYTVLQLLVHLPDQTILSVGPEPSFSVNAPGQYAILTLIFDPNTLDPASLVSGTTVAQLNALLFQGGGNICASLDLQGAEFAVIACGNPCHANAGADSTVTSCSNSAPIALFSCLGPDAWSGGTWTGPGGAPHSAVFVPGVDLPGVYTYVVNDVEPCPPDTAVVNVDVVPAPNAGTSTSITLYANDPALSLITALGGMPDTDGTWTGPDGLPLNGLFDASLYTTGTLIFTYTVAGLPPCGDAHATVTILLLPPPCTAGFSAETTVCFTDPPFAMLDLLGGEPCPGGTWTEPNGTPHGNVFTPGVDPAGVYVYTTTNGLGQVSSASLTINVVECADPCVGAAGEDAQAVVCNDGSMVDLFPFLGGSPVAGGFWLWMSIGNINPEITFGLYDSMIAEGGTAAYVAIGGPDCAPDTAFVEVIEIACNGIQEKPGNVGANGGAEPNMASGITDATGIDMLSVWPVPAADVVHVKLPAPPNSAMRIVVIDALGRPVRLPIAIEANNLTLDVRGLTAGSYRIEVANEGAVFGGRFIRTRD